MCAAPYPEGPGDTIGPHLEPALSTLSAPPALAWAELSGNSRQRFKTKNPIWHPDPNTVNSTTAIGFWPSLILEGVQRAHRARYYNPQTGRFISEDPTGFAGGINKYVYAHNDPIDRSDPFGLLDVFIWQARDGFGHASVQLDDGTYISWWPSAEGRSPIDLTPFFVRFGV